MVDPEYDFSFERDVLDSENIFAIGEGDLIEGKMPDESEPVKWSDWVIVKSEGQLYFMVPYIEFSDEGGWCEAEFAKKTGLDLDMVKCNSIVVDDNNHCTSYFVVPGYGCWVHRDRLIGLIRIGGSDFAAETASAWLAEIARVMVNQSPRELPG